MNDAQSKTDWIKAITYIGFIAGLILSGTNFAYKEWYKIPTLTYEILDSYPLSNDESIVPIIIRNEGHEKATNVRITIYTGGNIQSIQEKTPEELLVATDNNTLIANLPRLVDNSQITFYLRVKTFSRSPINEILIASDQGSGGIHESKSPINNIISTIIYTVISLVGVAIISAFIFGLKQRPPKRVIQKEMPD